MCCLLLLLLPSLYNSGPGTSFAPLRSSSADTDTDTSTSFGCLVLAFMVAFTF